jgi:UDP-glucose 4-epimerase
MKLRDRKIMVTGCAGFIASHLAEELLARGNEVVGLDNLSAGKREFMSNLMKDEKFSFVEGDLLTMDLASALKDVDVVCHLAANPDVRIGAKNTKVVYEQNIEVTYRLLEAGKDSGVKDIMFPSTSTVYGETDVIPTPEDSAH